MPVHVTYPGVYIEEIPSGVRTITGVATSITAFVGRAARGPRDKAVSINSFGSSRAPGDGTDGSSSEPKTASFAETGATRPASAGGCTSVAGRTARRRGARRGLVSG